MKNKRHSILKSNKARLAKFAPGAYETDICPECGSRMEWGFEGGEEMPSGLTMGRCTKVKECGFETVTKSEKGGFFVMRDLFVPVILAEIKKALLENEIFRLIATHDGAEATLPIFEGLIKFLFATRDAKTPMMVKFGLKFPGGIHEIQIWASHGETPVERAAALADDRNVWKRKAERYLPIVKHLASCLSCHCQTNARQAQENYHAPSCMIGKAIAALRDSGKEEPNG